MNIPDPLTLMAHGTSRRKVSGPTEMTTEEEQEMEDLVNGFTQLMHELVLSDAISDDDKSWIAMNNPVATASHCMSCAMLTVGAAVRVIAMLFYQANPGATPNSFVEDYKKVFGL